MIPRRALAVSLFAVVLACGGVLPVSDSFGDAMSARQIRAARRDGHIPDAEREMSNKEVVGLLGHSDWASSAVMLRCRLGNDKTRREIYRMLARVAVDYQDVPMAENAACSTAMGILHKQKEYRDDAVPAVLDVLAEAHTHVLIADCYSALGSLGGPESIRVLKEAIIEGPPSPDARRGAREQYFRLYNYLAYCGPDAAPALFEIAKEKSKVNMNSLYTALGTTRNESVVPYLLDVIREAEKTSREDPGAAETVKIASKALCYGVRSYSPENRAKIIESLLRNVDHPAWEVRSAIAWGLGVAGDSTYIPVLEKMALEDSFWYESTSSKRGTDKTVKKKVYPVREAAANALDSIRLRIAQKKKAAAQ